MEVMMLVLEQEDHAAEDEKLEEKGHEHYGCGTRDESRQNLEHGEHENELEGTVGISSPIEQMGQSAQNNEGNELKQDSFFEWDVRAANKIQQFNRDRKAGHGHPEVAHSLALKKMLFEAPQISPVITITSREPPHERKGTQDVVKEKRQLLRGRLRACPQ
ncbi:uncharacterized protein J3R85_004289 [Psidium guajava]|nr:uncharacterized protein J3R85_004289 [Psidium guajava]